MDFHLDRLTSVHAPNDDANRKDVI